MPHCSNTNKRTAMQAYIDRMNAGDLAGVVALYSDTATIEDPVGSGKIVTGKLPSKSFIKALCKPKHN